MQLAEKLTELCRFGTQAVILYDTEWLCALQKLLMEKVAHNLQLQLFEVVMHPNLITESGTKTLIKLDYLLWVWNYDYVPLCWFLFLLVFREITTNVSPQEATISVWMRGYRTVVRKSQWTWLMESQGYAVISLWLISSDLQVTDLNITHTDGESSLFFWAFSNLCSLITNTAHTQPGGWNLSHINYFNFFLHTLSKVVHHLRQEW